ncbi:facilitated trehalose transporter Tret1 [Parasteatoda tepidariorum]|uniref:facilitated trehalose transporter Tret1 n=1 Tax=Parasteatoda tepidariorum TaxID=114398 RepID=UPI00077FE0C1|nr:facilitated trehalose transporter Tret1 isoform X2 [Parasteatoda tepidariorum]XP_042908009.1 facilitated trehalose transporter Tret1 isoform X2 [Parasteatoda tepidariorum]XP_042908010.1 facilitated trehalose transporter Tret1 isoform X2 [Parasteatoda tepidariorum]
MENRKVFLVASAALMNAVTVGIASTYSSAATENMKNGKLNPSDVEVSWIGSILPLGAILGGLIAGYLSDRIGRKGVMLYQSLILVLGWLFIAYAPNLMFVYIGRFMTGICCGLICVVTPMYVIEISTAEMRGNLGSRFQLFICKGIIISSILGVFLPWQWFAIAGAVVGVSALLCVLFIPESPRWLVLQNKQSEAVEAVNFLYGSTGASSVNQLVSESLNIESSSIALHEILHPTFYKPAFLSIILMIFQQFSGSNAILYYTVSIFKQAGSFINPVFSNLLVAVAMYIFTLIATFSMDVIGRKKALYLSGMVTAISLSAMSVYLLVSSHDNKFKSNFSFMPLVCLIIYIAGFSLGLGPIPWLMMSEMSPVRGRGIICGLGTAFSWFFAFIVTKTFLQIEDLVGNIGAYWIYSGFCLCVCFFASFFLPETKGRTLEEIENHFAGGESRLQRLQELSNERYSDLEG